MLDGSRPPVVPKSSSEVVGEIVLGTDDETTVVGGGGARGVGETTHAPSRVRERSRVWKMFGSSSTS